MITPLAYLTITLVVCPAIVGGGYLINNLCKGSEKEKIQPNISKDNNQMVSEEVEKQKAKKSSFCSKYLCCCCGDCYNDKANMDLNKNIIENEIIN